MWDENYLRSWNLEMESKQQGDDKNNLISTYHLKINIIISLHFSSFGTFIALLGYLLWKHCHAHSNELQYFEENEYVHLIKKICMQYHYALPRIMLFVFSVLIDKKNIRRVLKASTCFWIPVKNQGNLTFTTTLYNHILNIYLHMFYWKF